MEEIIVSLIAGGLGGNIAGSLMKNKSLGILGNSIAGIIGGGLGGQILGMLGLGGDSMLATIGASTVGGGIVMLIVGFIKGAMSKKA
ncbi:GlsB/YeaQ/YmgE family stress response membrane protein [Fulvivirga sedimenti]|jgi:uncharacterized membrane protein YeaQ/YmgE (transglycosylase-associated protein family)|uniref:GlsB/YeaQ/YmgE family stress response membrane protein n=1 Tax=Fulvivirga sedimenti TaxID=2879465 RepID=A0A9X1HUK2_9BACT|nr:GlsB/YeaQ/YmgE family stress response membrane protein [Fulvivirga sedimenti]MCA6078201.1 GlsB/YeaQ/YmgE family stress response membrane protein [Fulvivirga sedimenti]